MRLFDEELRLFFDQELKASAQLYSKQEKRHNFLFQKVTEAKDQLLFKKQNLQDIEKKQAQVDLALRTLNENEVTCRNDEKFSKWSQYRQLLLVLKNHEKICHSMAINDVQVAVEELKLTKQILNENSREMKWEQRRRLDKGQRDLLERYEEAIALERIVEKEEKKLLKWNLEKENFFLRVLKTHFAENNEENSKEEAEVREDELREAMKSKKRIEKLRRNLKIQAKESRVELYEMYRRARRMVENLWEEKKTEEMKKNRGGEGWMRKILDLICSNVLKYHSPSKSE